MSDAVMTIEPTNNGLIVKVVGTPDRVSSGLYLPNEWAGRKDAALVASRVVKTGPGVSTNNPVTKERWKPGDIALHLVNAGLLLEFMPGHKLILEHEIKAAMEGDLEVPEEERVRISEEAQKLIP